MIQFNLLPDIKLQYIKAERQKRLVVSVSAIASIAAATLFVLMILTVDVVQKKSLSDLNRDISKDSAQLQSDATLNQVLTVQSQLTTLSGLHDQKPVVSRLFGYLATLTPSAAPISKLDANFDQHTISISGSADTLSTVGSFADTLKHATYTTTGSVAKPAFSDVVLSSFSPTNKSVTYTITASFDLSIFSESSENVTLTVPTATITTSSQAGQ